MSRSPADRGAHLEHIVHHAEHLLPGQRPIESFVHHNTLHSFEEMSFEHAAVFAGRRYGARAFMPEAEFRKAWAASRILDRDIQNVVERRVPGDILGAGMAGITERDAVYRMMLWLPADCSGPALRWRVTETKVLEELPAELPRDARERLTGAGRDISTTLQKLWRECEAYSATLSFDGPQGVRPRDLALVNQGVDPDRLVNPVLIRWCAAYLDHGQSIWPMGDRSQGFYRTMLEQLALGGVPLRGWMTPLRAKARALLAGNVSPTDCALRALDEMGVQDSDHEEVVTATLLSLSGWAGMFVQLADRPDLAPGAAMPTSVLEFLAIRLLLDQAALADAPDAPHRPQDAKGLRAWQMFHVALLVGLTPNEASPEAMGRISALLDRWPEEARGALWQLAYERRFRVTTLDALLAHNQRIRKDSRKTPRAQVVTCIDDREESFRRHLEELDPAWETFGYAGFFNVPMAFRALGASKALPLCPAGVVPRHLVEERPKSGAEHEWEQERGRRAWRGLLGVQGARSNASLVRGGLLSLGGIAALVPMVTSVLSPAARVSTPLASQVPTRLTVVHDPSEPEKDGKQLGFTIDECVNTVASVLSTTGLSLSMSPLIAFLGHGSSSMNNPHNAAYDCGACGGGKGGPNGRAFAIMANHPEIRAKLAERDIHIPDQTWFVGGYHNTADDSVEWYDLELVPAHLQSTLRRLQSDIDEARRRDAHERCRRFMSAPLDMTPDEALQHAIERANDFAQPRPEAGHATNALCFVGRRDWSRGLYLDRRVFLTSYDPSADNDDRLLESLLATVGPVGAGINLEYYFSFVDRDRYGCNTKLPHNITGLVGVMDGHASDLRPGLPWQMVEIHEPVRLLNIIEAKPEQLQAILARQPALARLVLHRWILVVAYDVKTGRMWFFDEDGFQPYFPESRELQEVQNSMDWYRGNRENLPPATIQAGRPEPTGGNDRGRAA